MVVWEGRRHEASPYPDHRPTTDSAGLKVLVDQNDHFRIPIADKFDPTGDWQARVASGPLA